MKIYFWHCIIQDQQWLFLQNLRQMYYVPYAHKTVLNFLKIPHTIIILNKLFKLKLQMNPFVFAKFSFKESMYNPFCLYVVESMDSLRHTQTPNIFERYIILYRINIYQSKFSFLIYKGKFPFKSINNFLTQQNTLLTNLYNKNIKT